MKEFIKTLKGKKVLSFVLAAIMLVTTFSVAVPVLKLDTNAAESIGGITQERVVDATTYEVYSNNFLNGAGQATDIVIPGLKAAYTDGSTSPIDYNDFVVQGLSYYPKQDWFMVTVYHNDGALPSMIFALDAKSGKFVKAFAVYNSNGTPNYDHGGGLAFSEYNFYYSGDDTDYDDDLADANQIAYASLDQFDNAVDVQDCTGAAGSDGICEITLEGAVSLPELGAAATAYVCYDEGILWAGNFYEDGTGGKDKYGNPVITSPALYNSMIYGYKLQGNSSQEEWNYLCGNFEPSLKDNNLINVTNSGESNSDFICDVAGYKIGKGSYKWSAQQNAEEVSITGSAYVDPTSVNPDSAVLDLQETYYGTREALFNEIFFNFGTANLELGKKYKLSFISNNRKSAMYLTAPGGAHCGMNQPSDQIITDLGDGRYLYEIEFTAGLKPSYEGLDCSWPDTPSTDSTAFTGTYTLRFDQDLILAGEGTRNFEITDIRISEYSTKSGCAGKPSHCIAVHTDYEDIQYATVDNGRIYMSCSWGTGKNDEWFANTVIQGIGNTPDYSSLIVGDMDLSQPGDVTISYTANGETVTTTAHEINADNTTHFDMMPMSEGLCFVEDNLYISFEGASNKYMNEYSTSSGLTNTGNCDYPIDVIWKVDPYTLMDETRTDTEASAYYEKVTALEDLNDEDEYIIVYESKEKDPVTQKNILYAFDAYGNFKDFKLSKSTDFKKLGYEGMIGYPISEYSLENNKLYFTNPERDDISNIRWHLDGVSDTAGITSSGVNIQSELPYFMRNRNFYFENGLVCMASDAAIAAVAYSPITLEEAGDTGNFYLKSGDSSYLWCNDFSVPGYEAAANDWYEENDNTLMYEGIIETKGTFHTNATGTDNIIGKSIGANDYLRQISIYKCVADTYSSTAKNRVYTDMSAELKSDGTYTVTLDTYATSALHYKSSGVEKPTDYILVMDASNSMSTGDGTGMIKYSHTTNDFGSGDLAVYSIAGESKKTAFWDGVYQITNENGAVGIGNIYVKIGDEYVNIGVETSAKSGNNQYVWIYGTYRGRVYYWKPEVVDNPEKYGTWVDTKPSESETILVKGNDTRARGNTVIYYGEHYRYSTNDYAARLKSAQDFACNIVDKIAADNSDNRIALVQYGADGSSGYYNTSGNLSRSGYTDAFWSTDSAESLKAKINAITTSTQTSDAGIELQYANSIISNNIANYTADGDRNVAIIFISDGVPGADAESATTTAANEVIGEAATAKNNGAFIYTVLVGQDSATDFDKVDYMLATSSQYPDAKSLTSLGGECTESTTYFYNLSEAIANFFVNSTDFLLKNTNLNDDITVQKLEGDTIIYEQLSDAFIIPDEYDYDVELYKGYYDCLGRFQFETTVNPNPGVTVTPQIVTLDNGRPAIKIVGFNYSDQYIANGHDGNILRVTINGLEANHEADITNTSINDTATTAIYQSSNIAEPFKYFPTEYFTIPEYNYVFDYDMPMYDTDINGTLKSVDGTPTKQTTTKVSRENSNIALNFVDDCQNMTYELKSGVYNKYNNASYCLIQRDDGTYDWFKINIVPASNVLLEEQRFILVSKDGAADWSVAGTALGNTYQSLSGKNDRYGYDDVYADNGAGYSNGTAYKATVNSTTKRSETMKFSYTGTGFDLMAACGPNTGIQMVNIKDSSGKIEKLLIVDTYYNGDYIDANYGTLNQVPVVSYTNTGGYGTYNVEVTAAYLSTAQGVTGARSVSTNSLLGGVLNAFSSKAEGYSVESLLDDMDIDIPADEVELVWFDDNSVLNGGTGPVSTASKARSTSTASTNVSLDCYVDGIRVYNPLGSDYSHYIDSEKGAQYYNIIDELATADENGVIKAPDGQTSLFAYVTGTLESDENGNTPTLSFANYQSVGPQHELYLEEATGADGSHAVSFNVTVPDSSSRVMISLRAVDGATTAKVASGDKSIEFTVNTATEQYFDITPYLDIDTTTGKANVIITNIGTGLLSVNNLKLVGGAVAAISDEDLPVMAMSLAAEPITVDPNAYDYDAPVVEEDVQEPEADTPAEDDTPEADEPVADVPMDLTSIIKMLLKFIETIILKFF